MPPSKQPGGEPDDGMGTDTKRLMALREEQARTNAKSLFISEQLLEEVRALRQDMAVTARDLQDHKLERSQEQAVLAGTLATMQAQIATLTSQFGEMKTAQGAKQAAWTGVMPSIVSSVAGALLASAITAAVVLAMRAQVTADHSQPAPASAPAKAP